MKELDEINKKHSPLMSGGLIIEEGYSVYSSCTTFKNHLLAMKIEDVYKFYAPNECKTKEQYSKYVMADIYNIPIEYLTTIEIKDNFYMCRINNEGYYNKHYK